jgi:hypothetical protein
MSPQAELIRMVSGIWTARALYAAAELRLPDRIAAGERSVHGLAKATGTNRQALYRLMRALAGCGLLTEDSPGHFDLTSLGEALTSDAPGKARAAVLTLAGDWQWKAWEGVLYSLRTGRPAMFEKFGKGLFPHLAEQPEQGKLFNEAMIAIHGDDGPAAVEAYDFSKFRRIADLGGGTGSLLAAILESESSMRGLLFESEGAMKEAARLLRDRGLSERCDVAVGDFFQAVPAGYDAYLLSHVLHDWTDDEASVILQNCRKAVPRAGRLLILEAIVPSDNGFHPAKMMDLLMLTVTGGAERTIEGFSTLLSAAGFEITAVAAMRNGQSIIEAVPSRS